MPSYSARDRGSEPPCRQASPTVELSGRSIRGRRPRVLPDRRGSARFERMDTVSVDGRGSMGRASGAWRAKVRRTCAPPGPSGRGPIRTIGRQAGPRPGPLDDRMGGSLGLGANHLGPARPRGVIRRRAGLLPVRSLPMSATNPAATPTVVLSAALVLLLGACPATIRGQRPSIRPHPVQPRASSPARSRTSRPAGRPVRGTWTRSRRQWTPLRRRRRSGRWPSAGITELRFAGATWQTGGTSGLTLAVFEADGPGCHGDARLLRDPGRELPAEPRSSSARTRPSAK